MQSTGILLQMNYGHLVGKETKMVIINGNRNGTSKQLYTNPSNEIKIEIDEFLRLVDGFLETEDKIASLVKDVCK